MLLEPNCWTRKCEFYVGVKQLNPEMGELSEVHVCPAFPFGIPLRIAYEGDKHTEVAVDQTGEVVYQKDENWPEQRALKELQNG